jgi:hypothetical protein
MQPIYFPFTHISKPVVDALGFCFRQSIVYQPARFTVSENLQNWSQDGVLQIRIPFEGDEERLAAILKDYREWAKLHHDSRGLQNAFTRNLSETVPFFDETSTSRIKADIKKGEQQNQLPREVDPTFGARLFLAIAQEFDMETERLRQDLFSIKAIENNLLADLEGGDRPGDKFAGKNNNSVFNSGDDAAYMIPERFMAWFRIMQFDRELGRDNYGLFVTSSRSALDYLLDSTSQTEKILTVDAIPVSAQKSAEIEAWRDHLTDQLQRLPATSRWKETVKVTDAPADKNCKLSASLTLYVVPEESPRSLFSRCAGRAFLSAGDETRESHIKNSFVGYVSLHPTL